MYVRQTLFSKGRSKVLFFLYIGVFILILVKLFNTQVINANYWKSVADSQQSGVSKVFSKRGEIYSSDGYPLALSVYSYELIANPSVATNISNSDIEKIYSIVYADSKNEDKDKIIFEWKKLLNDRDKKFGYLAKDLNYEQKQKINLLNIPYLSLNPIPSRSYPDTESYSHLLGFVGKDTQGGFKGYFGVEGFYDGDLRGIDGFTISEKSAGGFPLLFKDFTSVDKKNGADIVLTIDRNVQTIAYEEIKNAVEKYKAKTASVVIINPQNGEITALANYPTFNPIEYGEHFLKNPDLFVNNVVSSTYEPGSIVKALTVASAIDLGLINENTIVDDSGPKQYSGYTVDNWDGKHHGQITATQVLELSNNIGASDIGIMVGSHNLYDYFKKFGISSKSGIDLEGEESGFMRDYSTWEDIDLVTASFGQGLSVTPLQMASAFGALANKGVLYKPHIVVGAKIGSKIVSKQKVESSKVVSEKTADTLVKMLTSAASSGEAKYFISKKYLIAGKTGTAQIAENGKYLADETNATFVGFLPNYKEFVMLVKIEKPTSSVYASETAVPTWMNIAERLASYYGFSPDKNAE